MRKIILSATLAVLISIAGVAKAQEKIPLFSPSLFTGTEYYREGTKRKTVTHKASVIRQRVVLRFSEGVTELNEEQKKQLIPIVERAQQKKISEIQLTAFSDTAYHSYLRILMLRRYFNAYLPGIKIRGRSADTQSVMEANNNTVDIVEVK